jgi:hypothetical protein
MTQRLSRLKASLRRRRITAWQIANAAGVTDTYVWMVLNGRRKSDKVIAVAERLLAEPSA